MSESVPRTRQPRRGGGPAAAWAAAALLFAASLFLFTRHNAFPYFLHPDEPSKARQVSGDSLNFHHPPLLLLLTRAAAGGAPPGTSYQQAAEAGRLVSACLASLAVVAGAWLAWRMAGTAAGISCGVLLLLNNQLYELAHYLKEDTAMAAGVVGFFAALWWFGARPSAGRALLLGAGAAFACSGKYLGATTLLCLPFVFVALARSRKDPHAGRHAAMAAASMAFCFVLFNWPLVAAFGDFISGFSREMDFAVRGHKGSTRSVPHLAYTSAMSKNTTVVIWVLLAAYAVGLWRRRKEVGPAEWAVACWPVAYVLLLSFSPKTNDRYFLPATVLFTAMATCGIPVVARGLAGRTPIPFGAAALGLGTLAAGVQLPRSLEYWQAFRSDDRALLRQYIETNLPSDATILQDRRVHLPTPDNRYHSEAGHAWRFRVIGADLAADFAPLEELSAKGVTHVAVALTDYGRYLDQDTRPRAGAEEDFERRRLFYRRLIAEGELIWDRRRSKVVYLHPGLKLFRVPTQDTPAPPQITQP